MIKTFLSKNALQKKTNSIAYYFIRHFVIPKNDDKKNTKKKLIKQLLNIDRFFKNHKKH